MESLTELSRESAVSGSLQKVEPLSQHSSPGKANSDGR